MSRTNNVIADSSFYICFLDDISRPSFLQLVFSNSFQFLTTRILHNEIKKSKNYFQIQNNGIIELSFSYDISEILRPFFGRNEILKGEHEVIAFAFILYQINHNFGIILDEIGPRRFVEKNFPYLVSLMNGTVGFVGRCHCDYNIISKKETLDILQAIKNSKFRVSNNIISSVESEVKSC